MKIGTKALASCVAIASLWLTASSGAVAATPIEPQFASVFGSGMVLPFGEPVTLSGHAAPGVQLIVKVGERDYGTRSNARGEWRVQLQPLPAGGPYTIKLQDKRGAGATLTDVLAGEVWLCSGQSNMEFQVAMSTDQPAEVMQGHPAIRLLSVPHLTGLSAQESFAQPLAWQSATADSIKRFSALCYFFARRKISDDGLPIGLINASWGGSAIEPWISERQLATMPEYRHQVDLLRQYRTDQRKAELAFGADWVKWWQASSRMGPVWQRGVLDGNPEWQDAPLVDWRSYADPRLKSFTGNLWFSKSFELSAVQSAKGATFVLGKIDEVDTTWVNGKFVNNSFGYGTRREYRLEPGMLQAGTNQFSVFVTNTYEAGGMLGPVEDVGIRFDDGEFVNLGSGWKYRVVPKETGYPPRAPSESVHGVSGMFNGMIAPLRALVPSGVIWYQGESNVDNAGAYGQLLTSLIRDWRAYFGSQLPFIIVQLPNYGAVAQAPAESGWATLRNAQQQVALHDARVGLVVTQDLGNDADIHPRLKYAVAERAVQAAHALKGSGAKNGVVAQITINGRDKLVLEFNPPLSIGPPGKPVDGFSLCRSVTNSCVAARATQHGSRIEVERTALPDATRLRYCWSDGGVCGLKSLAGLPVASFELALDAPRPGAPTASCDRACLRDTITQYLEAMLKHDPAKLPLAANARFTEDTRELKLGEGLWRDIESLSGFRQDILDVKKGVAGVHVKVMAGGKPVLAAIRIQMDGRKIAGVESMVVRSREEGMIFNVDAIAKASDAMNLTPTAAQRNTREDMEKLALLYPEGLRMGSFVKADAKFAPEAYRFENGQLMAGPGCTFIKGCDHIREQALPTLAGIKAMVAAVDEEQGIVWLRMNFGKGSLMRGSGELSVFEMFKVYDGRINAVEAFMKEAPENTPFLWQY
jgi:sialate O-acetylesterase